MRGTKIIVMQYQYMQQLYKNHMPNDSTTKLARDYFY